MGKKYVIEADSGRVGEEPVRLALSEEELVRMEVDAIFLGVKASMEIEEGRVDIPYEEEIKMKEKWVKEMMEKKLHLTLPPK